MPFCGKYDCENHVELSALSPALKKECKRIWKSKNAKQRTNTLKMFADEALQVCK